MKCTGDMSIKNRIFTVEKLLEGKLADKTKACLSSIEVWVESDVQIGKRDIGVNTDSKKPIKWKYLLPVKGECYFQRHYGKKLKNNHSLIRVNKSMMNNLANDSVTIRVTFILINE